jgi:glycosyltransferase involved in cell wall biosynthesis
MTKEDPRMTVDASVIVSTYNNPRALEAIIARLRNGTCVPKEILVADDGSTDETRTMLDAAIRGDGSVIRHCWHPDEGFRKTRILNQCVARAEGDYLVFLDGDCLPHPRWLEDHLRLAERGTFVQGRRAFIPERFVDQVLDGKMTVQRLFWSGRLDGAFKAIRLPVPRIRRDRDMHGLLGCNLAMWRSDVFHVNGLDEEFEGWGIGEDSDLCARLYNLGIDRKIVHGRGLVYHLNHPELPRTHVPESNRRLQRAIDEGLIRCEAGLDRHLETLA